ncbi:MAG: TonB-dependent receptor [Acidobacteriota bacterium]|nr:TonB-dependent receptor [Acidobacteriota bacterium]
MQKPVSSSYALLFAVLLAFPMHASIVSSALTGRVTVNDKPAAGATVTIALRAAKSIRTTTTNARGTYWIAALSPGIYDVTFERPGLTSLTRPVTIELGRVARADGKLEVSDDEESVTSTAITVSVANTTAITTHFSADELERIPLRRDVKTAETLSPVLPFNEVIVDDTVMFHPTLLGEEALDETTVVRGAQAIELGRFGSSVILARTRSGRDDLFLSLRDTYYSGDDGSHVVEGAAGGAAVRDRLWFFGSGWGGNAADLRVRDLRGITAKLTAQASESHHLAATHTDARAKLSLLEIATTTSALRYTGVFDQKLTAEAVMSRADADAPQLRDDVVSARVSYRAADHVVSIGGDRGTLTDVDAYFLSDRWASGRWTVDAGIRWEDERTLTRVAFAFDLRSEQGSHAVVASWGEYLEAPRAQSTGSAPQVLRVASIGYTSSLESSGTARIDLFRYEGARRMDQVQTDVRYRLFDRFEAGGSYVYTRTGQHALFAEEIPEHLVSAHVGVQLPLAGREFSAMALERYDATNWITDLGIRYEIPIRRVTVTLAGDATNVFNAKESGGTLQPLPRAYRFWIRARL